MFTKDFFLEYINLYFPGFTSVIDPYFFAGTRPVFDSRYVYCGNWNQAPANTSLPRNGNTYTAASQLVGVNGSIIFTHTGNGSGSFIGYRAVLTPVPEIV